MLNGAFDASEEDLVSSSAVSNGSFDSRSLRLGGGFFDEILIFFAICLALANIDIVLLTGRKRGNRYGKIIFILITKIFTIARCCAKGM